LAWDEMLAANANGMFPYTPSTNLLQGMRVAVEMLHEEGLDAVFARHERAARAVRQAVTHWGFEIQCADPSNYSASLTAVRLPEGYSADALRAQILDRCNVSLGNGLGRLADTVFRIGHLGDFNEPAIIGTLGAIAEGLQVMGIPHREGGVEAALKSFAGNLSPSTI